MLSRCAVFIDFDNTITQFDVVDRLLERFAVNDAWRAFEAEWQAGRIGSQLCLERQLACVNVTARDLKSFLVAVPLDSHFKRLLALCRRHGVPPVIVSDGFASFIRAILEAHRVTGLTVHANEVQLAGQRLVPSFPYVDGCPRCAHCKKLHVLQGRAAGRITVYIGDGLSDVCPAQHADLVFAKASLLEACRASHIPCVPFTTLGDVHDYFTVTQP